MWPFSAPLPRWAGWIEDAQMPGGRPERGRDEHAAVVDHDRVRDDHRPRRGMLQPRVDVQQPIVGQHGMRHLQRLRPARPHRLRGEGAGQQHAGRSTIRVPGPQHRGEDHSRGHVDHAGQRHGRERRRPAARARPAAWSRSAPPRLAPPREATQHALRPPGQRPAGRRRASHLPAMPHRAEQRQKVRVRRHRAVSRPRREFRASARSRSPPSGKTPWPSRRSPAASRPRPDRRPARRAASAGPAGGRRARAGRVLPTAGGGA